MRRLVSDADGRYTLPPLAPGDAAVIELSAPGYTRAVRRVSITAHAGAHVRDARLTPLAPASRSAAPAAPSRHNSSFPRPPGEGQACPEPCRRGEGVNTPDHPDHPTGHAARRHADPAHAAEPAGTHRAGAAWVERPARRRYRNSLPCCHFRQRGRARVGDPARSARGCSAPPIRNRSQTRSGTTTAPAVARRPGRRPQRRRAGNRPRDPSPLSASPVWPCSSPIACPPPTDTRRGRAAAGVSIRCSRQPRIRRRRRRSG